MTVLSTLRRDRREIEYAEKKAKARLGVQPALDFYGSPEMDKEESNSLSDIGHNQKATDQHRVFNVLLHPQNPHNKETYEIRVKTFKSGTPEEWCRLREQVETLAMRQGHKVSDQYQDDDILGDVMSDVLIPLYTAVLEGRVSRKFEEHMTLNDEKTARVRLTIALNEIVKSVFNNPAEAYTVQKRYLKKSGLRMWKAKPSEFGHHLETLNSYLEYFPR
jgi:hypothetical protein